MKRTNAKCKHCSIQISPRRVVCDKCKKEKSYIKNRVRPGTASPMLCSGCGAPSRSAGQNRYRSVLCRSCIKIKIEKQENTEFLKKNSTLVEYQSKLSVKGKHPSWVNSHIRNFNRSWNKLLTKIPCLACGYNLHIELAHIKDVASFPQDALLGEINSPDNIYSLCRNCHWEFDNGYSALVEHKIRVRREGEVII